MSTGSSLHWGRLRGCLLTLALSGASGLAPAAALARQHADYGYSQKRVWMTAVRLMRVDYASPITEKDREDGYFLFEYPYQGRSYAGSVEVVPIRNEGGDRVRVAIQLAGMPSYVERMMLDKLGRKLEADFGPPDVGSRARKGADKDAPSKRDKGAKDDEPGDGNESPPKDAQGHDDGADAPPEAKP